jgi:hypothetical protein
MTLEVKSARARVAVAGAGIYGSTVAIRLAELGYDVHLYDPLGVMRAASAINQYRVHAGYHYPRSPETIDEILEAREEFVKMFTAAIVRSTRNYYAIPWEGSWTQADRYEEVMERHCLPLKACRPEWLDFDFIERCYEVDEEIYDPDLLRSIVESRLHAHGVRLVSEPYTQAERGEYDFVVCATYGLGPSKSQFHIAKFQVVEKILIEVPAVLQHIGLVVVDGPFTAFDPYGSTTKALFGSAKHTNHWETTDPDEPIPSKFDGMLNLADFRPCDFSNFEKMRVDSGHYVPALNQARYLGSRFTERVVEDSPADDRRVLYLQEGEPNEFHIFSGKVLGAVKAARMVCELLDSRS